MVAALSGQAPSSSIRAAARETMSRIITISTGGSIRSSSMPTSNIAAPISKRRIRALDDAQLAKKRHLAAKLLIGRGDRVLDIGSGWGGLGLYLAEMTGADVTGVTLSTEQLQVSNARAAEKNLTRSARFPARGLSRHSRPVRPHRVGRHVRTCRRRLLRDLFQALRRTSHRRRRHGAALDRPLDRSRRHQSLDHEVHLPRRLHPGRSPKSFRRSSGRASGLRHRNPAAALRAKR